METTRHFVATVYVVNGGAVALHEHDRLGMWLPPGGHVEREELPHEAARREVREELGLDVELVAPVDDLQSPTAASIPKPQHFLLEDINVCDGEVGHQHVDFVYYGTVGSRDLDPAPGEAILTPIRRRLIVIIVTVYRVDRTQYRGRSRNDSQ
ncbi:NUDIX hydrolase [Halobacteriales archaeon QH_7_66_37]|nr:MAG: NUDIX hydrolase [Halobacteriales archaeon QH_7_66_37]